VILQAFAVIEAFPPSITSKTSFLLHWLRAAIQCIPVVSWLLQVAAPQVQVTLLFSEVPSMISHALSLLHLLFAAVQNIPVVDAL
jgi:hypothetical protein